MFQVEVFQELNSKKISAASATRMASRANSATSAQSGAAVAGGAPPLLQGDSIFSSQDDRQLLLALLLHCADIGNSVKPWAIAKKWALPKGLYTYTCQEDLLASSPNNFLLLSPIVPTRHLHTQHSFS